MDIDKINLQLREFIEEDDWDTPDIDELISDLDGAEIKAIFDKYCKKSSEYETVKELLTDDYEANYEEAEQLMIDGIKNTLSYEKLEKIIDNLLF